MKKSYLASTILIMLLSVSLGVRAATVYPPTEIPFDYDPNSVEYKLLGGIDARAGQPLVVDINCYDPDGDPFSIKVLNEQSGMICTNGTTWRLKWTPNLTQEGLHYINIEAWDSPPNLDNSLTDRGTLVFNVRPRNRPPVLSPCGG